MVTIAQSTKYTIIIAKQKEEYFIYPDNNVYWYLNPGDEIHFINTTKDVGILNMKAADYFQDISFNISANDTKIKEVLDMTDAKSPLEITFTIPSTQEGLKLVVFGGPKMVPTDPQF